MRSFLVNLISTFFYVGYLPFIPGTFASIAAILFFVLCRHLGFSEVLMTFLIITAGFLVCGSSERKSGKKDPGFIVIDEVAGMFISLLFLPYSLKILALGFLLFRILDTLKPFPAGCLERRRGGIGIMSDDIIAGFYTNIILHFVVSFTSFKTS